MQTQTQNEKKAVLVAVRQARADELEFEASLAELERLVTTLGYRVVGRVVQTRQSPAAAAVLGEGKLEELGALTGGTGRVGSSAPHKKEDKEDEEGQAADREILVDLVAVDQEVTPSQLRNLERATGTNVLHRTGVIIEIFHRHARSREARLEVEIARGLDDEASTTKRHASANHRAARSGNISAVRATRRSSSIDGEFAIESPSSESNSMPCNANSRSAGAAGGRSAVSPWSAIRTPASRR